MRSEVQLYFLEAGIRILAPNLDIMKGILTLSVSPMVRNYGVIINEGITKW